MNDIQEPTTDLQDKTNDIYKKIKIRKFGSNQKSLLLISFLLIATPLTVFLSMKSQENRSRASEEVLSDQAVALTTRKFVMGVSLPVGLSDKDNNNSQILSEIDSFSAPVSRGGVGSYPGSFTFFINFSATSDPDSPRADFPNLTVLRGLDSRGITPLVYLQPTGIDTNRNDGKFKFSTSTDPSTVQPGQILFDNSTPASITKIYLSKKGEALSLSKGVYPNITALVNTYKPGSRISIYPSTAGGAPNYTSTNKFIFSVKSTTDGGLYWIVDVRPVSTSVFKNDAVVWPAMNPTDNANQYSNSSITSGSMDSYFRTFAQAAQAYGNPVVLRYAHEMNGAWFPWAPGQPTAKDAYGRYNYFNVGNNSANYVTAWRHIYNVVKPIAPNVKFYWCPYLIPDVAGTSKFYPGSSYVDYVGFDAYQWNGTTGPSMHNLLAPSIANLRKFVPRNADGTSKIPIIIGETGINSVNGGTTANYRRSWFTVGYPDVYSSFKDVKGIIYFDFNLNQANWTLEGNPSAVVQYANIVSDPKFQGNFGPLKPKPSATNTLTPTKNPSTTPTPTKKPTPTPTKIASRQAVFNPIADALVDRSAPNTNYGDSVYLKAKYNATKSFLKFDLSSLSGKTIEKVLLRVKTADISGATSTSLERVSIVTDDAWHEATITENNKPSIGDNLGTFTADQPSKEFQATLGKGYFQNNVGKKVSLVIVNNSPDNVIFNSKENADIGPGLIITYH